MSKIRVLLADDHAVLRSGLRLLINTQPDMEVIGEAASFDEAVQASAASQPDVVTLDLDMPSGGYARGIANLLRECPKTRVLVLTVHDDLAYMRSCLAAGACGYVVKKAADTELLTAIRTVARGRTYVNVAQGDLKAAVNVTGTAGTSVRSDLTPLDSLSSREREVLKQVAEGHTNQAIADKLFLSVKTVESYRSRLMTKLGLRTRADLMRLAIDAGLLGSETEAPPDAE
jgi:two-component system response regulator NreC